MVAVLAVVCVGLGLAFRLSGGVAVWRGWIGAGVGSLGIWLMVASALAVAMMAGVAVYLSVERK